MFDEADDPGAVVEGGFLGEEAFAGGSVVGVAEVGEDDGGRGGGVGDDAYADFVGGTFEAEGYHFFHFWERVGFEVLGICFVLFFSSLGRDSGAELGRAVDASEVGGVFVRGYR